MENLIEIKNVYKTFETKNPLLGQKTEPVHALKDVSLDIKRGEITGLVGESGSGKSTLGNCILKLLDTNGGEILYGGKDIKSFKKSVSVAFCKRDEKILASSSLKYFCFNVLKKEVKSPLQALRDSSTEENSV